MTIIVANGPWEGFTLPSGRTEGRHFTYFCADVHPCDHWAVLENVASENPDAVIFTLSPFVIATSYAKDVYVPVRNEEGACLLVHPDCETFGLTPNQIYTNVFNIKLRCPEFTEELKQARHAIRNNPEAAVRYSRLLALGAAGREVSP